MVTYVKCDLYFPTATTFSALVKSYLRPLICSPLTSVPILVFRSSRVILDRTRCFVQPAAPTSSTSTRICCLETVLSTMVNAPSSPGGGTTLPIMCAFPGRSQNRLPMQCQRGRRSVRVGCLSTLKQIAFICYNPHIGGLKALICGRVAETKYWFCRCVCP